MFTLNTCLSKVTSAGGITGEPCRNFRCAKSTPFSAISCTQVLAVQLPRRGFTKPGSVMCGISGSSHCGGSQAGWNQLQIIP